MTKLYHYILISVFVFFQAIEPGNSQSAREIHTLEEDARIQFDNYRFHLALPMFLKLNQIHPQEIYYKYFLAYCYIQLDNNVLAMPYFEECLKSPEKFPASLNYYAARTFHLSEKYEEALKYYHIYRTHLIKNKKKNKLFLNDVDREIAMSETALELVKHPLDIAIVNLGTPINSEYPEYAPVLSADESTLLFTSTRPTTTGGKIDELDGDYFEDIYISYKIDQSWSEPQIMGNSINTNGHDASIALSADGQKLLLYRYGDDPLTASASGNLYVSELYGNSWIPAVQLPNAINSENWEPSASFSPDEKILYFASDRPGGFGGTDIYFVKKLPNGEWALPMNMGATINTALDEDSPYMHPDGKSLYFSSNGHKTMGGYDIFLSHLQNDSKSWSKPENVGYPINTPHDDLHFSWTADGRRVYFSSIRPEGQGDRDIYYADIRKEAAEVMVVKGLVLDSLTGKPIEARISITDKLSNESTERFTSNSITGKYLLLLSEGKNYKLTVEATNYKVFEEDINISNLHQFEERLKNIYLNPDNSN